MEVSYNIVYWAFISRFHACLLNFVIFNIQELDVNPLDVLGRIHSSDIQHVDDMINLSDLQERSILRNIYLRYLQNIIYVSFILILIFERNGIHGFVLPYFICFLNDSTDLHRRNSCCCESIQIIEYLQRIICQKLSREADVRIESSHFRSRSSSFGRHEKTYEKPMYSH